MSPYNKNKNGLCTSLTTANQSHISQLMGWFTNEQALKVWSGPNFRYPFDLETFMEDLRLEPLSAFALLLEDGKSAEGKLLEGKLLAFGQFYLRLGKCHLGRLIVNPEYRGQGIAGELIEKLSKQGMSQLKVDSCSLFVYTHNISAIRSYEKSGFTVTPYPEKIPIENCPYLYMVK